MELEKKERVMRILKYLNNEEVMDELFIKFPLQILLAVNTDLNTDPDLKGLFFSRYNGGSNFSSNIDVAELDYISEYTQNLVNDKVIKVIEGSNEPFHDFANTILGNNSIPFEEGLELVLFEKTTNIDYDYFMYSIDYYLSEEFNLLRLYFSNYMLKNSNKVDQWVTDYLNNYLSIQ